MSLLSSCLDKTICPNTHKAKEKYMPFLKINTYYWRILLQLPQKKYYRLYLSDLKIV